MTPPRPQPYGLGTGRGQFERVYGPRGWRRPFLAGGLEIVGSTVATVPPSLGSNGDVYIVVPVPSGVAAGDRLLTGLYKGLYGSGWPYPPAGWNLLEDVGGPGGAGLGIFERVAGASEPASYTWVASAGSARGAEMIAIRNALSVGPSDAAAGTFTVPDLTATAGSMLVAFSSCITAVVEDWVAVAPLSLQRQHVTAHAGIPYGSNAGGVLATEASLTPGVISGRTFSKPSSNAPSAGGVIVKP